MAAEELRDETFSICNTINTRMYNVERTFFILRPIRSLKPYANTSIFAPKFPPLSATSESYLGRSIRDPLNVEFEAWRYAPRKWRNWRNRVIHRHSRTWREARIDEAIESSLYHVPHKQDFVVELVKHWCPSSNTFFFPWGEVTITLEDVWVLGGYSVLGAPVSLPLKTESVDKFDKMLEFQIDMFDRDPENQKLEQVNWMEYFTNDQIEKKEEHNEEFEHVAFLSMWLSSFVFPYKDPENAINKDVFAIAVHLSEGTRLALASSVLAGVYHFMTLLKQKVFLSTETGPEKIAGPFELVHQWALERFPTLAPPPMALETGQARAARWHKRDLGLNYRNVDDYLEADHTKIFQWRPYASEILNWSSHYNDDERDVVAGSGSEKDLSFGVCLCACELEGVAGVPNQKYMPHRVTRQFGMDQHFPGEFAVMKPHRIDKFSFFIPAKGYKPTMSVWYYNWWKESWMDYEYEDNFRASTMVVEDTNIEE